MALPKLDTPTYRLTLPSTREEIQYRPFLVKEQKLLMMAQESESDEEIVDAISSLVKTCTFDKIDPENSPMYDIEYIFLQIRGKSVGEKIQLQIVCPDDEQTRVDIELDITSNAEASKGLKLKAAEKQAAAAVWQARLEADLTKS